MPEDVPFTSENGVKSVLKSFYGLRVEKITRLDSYYNFNFLVKCLKADATDAASENYVVKIFNTRNDSFFDNAELQHVLMKHLNENSISCSNPIPTMKGDTYVKCSEGQSDYLLQVVTFLPGQSVNSAVLGVEEYQQICFETGKSLAKLHKAARTLEYDFKTTTPNFSWLPHKALGLCSKLPYVQNERVRKTATKYMESFKKNFLSRLPELRTGFIHSDFSDTNVIFKKANATAPSRGNNSWQYSGVVDFEHCHYGYPVADLGVSVAYFMTKSISIPRCDVIEAAGQQIRGYQEVIPLIPAEKKVFVEVVTSRLASSYISGSHQSHRHPENMKFIFAQAKYIPSLFEILQNIGCEELKRKWFENV